MLPEQSVTNLPLHERLALLASAVSPAPAEGIAVGSGQSCRARIITLTPGDKLPDGSMGCVRGNTQAVIEEMFQEAIRVEVTAA